MFSSPFFKVLSFLRKSPLELIEQQENTILVRLGPSPSVCYISVGFGLPVIGDNYTNEVICKSEDARRILFVRILARFI